MQLLKYIKRKCSLDWRVLIANFRYEQYIWRCYPNLKENYAFEAISNKLELRFKTQNLPKNIIFLIGLVNKITYFNRRIKYCLYILHWNQRIFMYYNRYYRYLCNDKMFGKNKKFLNYKHGHKLHFVAYMYHRQFTGVRLDKNHLRY